MKNYLLTIVVDNDNHDDNQIFASLQSKENLTPVQISVNDAVIAAAQPLVCDGAICITPTRNVIYAYETDDFDDSFESICRQIGFRKCDKCGAWIPPQDVRNNTSCYLGNNIRYCSTCSATLRLQDVHEYHETQRQLKFFQLNDENMTPDTFKGIGIEMECDKRRGSMRNTLGRITCTQAFYDECTKSRGSKRVWRLEKDSSLSNGVEFISNCMSLAYAKAYDWSILTDQMKHLGCEDDIRTSGFHIHFSKLLFGDDEKTQALNALKLYYFMSIYKLDFFKVSGRQSMEHRYRGDEMYYCRFLEKSEVDEIKNNILSYTGSDIFLALPRYHDTCIITSGHTIEARIFKSTSDPERIKHTLELMVGIIEALKSVRFEKIYCLGKMLKHVSKDTLDYWRAKGCFLRTYATQARGETL